MNKQNNNKSKIILGIILIVIIILCAIYVEIFDNSENVKPEEDNNTSIVIQLNYGDTKFLFMGDSEEKVEKNLLKADKLEEVDVLKVAHHGSNSSTSQAFLDKIKPKYSIISVNHEEYKKHPSDKALQRLNDAKSIVYRTDEKGTIWITSDGAKSNMKINFLDININGDDKKEKLLGDRRYSLIFYCKRFPALSTTL